MDQELETFKKTPFQSIAERFGYSVDERESSINSRILRGPDNDKISVRQEADGHWTYFSVRDDEDNGTIIDFVKLRRGLNLGQARKVLRTLLQEIREGGSRYSFSYCPPQETQETKAKAKDPIPDPKSLLSGIDHPYLVLERKIPTWVFRDSRFVGIILKDPKFKNVMFPHRNQGEICGYEVRNRNKFAGYLGIREGLWITNKYHASETIVICESAIDCLSHAALFPQEKHSYISLAGSPSKEQKELLGRIFQWALSMGKEIIIGTDNDDQGEKYFKTFEALAPKGLILKRSWADCAKDWNDLLRGEVNGAKYF